MVLYKCISLTFLLTLDVCSVSFIQGKLALSAWNGCFLSLPDNEKGNLFCTSTKAGDREVIQVFDSVTVSDKVKLSDKFFLSQIVNNLIKVLVFKFLDIRSVLRTDHLPGKTITMLLILVF